MNLYIVTRRSRINVLAVASFNIVATTIELAIKGSLYMTTEKGFQAQWTEGVWSSSDIVEVKLVQSDLVIYGGENA